MRQDRRGKVRDDITNQPSGVPFHHSPRISQPTRPERTHYNNSNIPAEPKSRSRREIGTEVKGATERQCWLAGFFLWLILLLLLLLLPSSSSSCVCLPPCLTPWPCPASLHAHTNAQPRPPCLTQTHRLHTLNNIRKNVARCDVYGTSGRLVRWNILTEKKKTTAIRYIQASYL